MTQWKKVQGSQAERPLALDVASSPSTVYQRRNIKCISEDQQPNLWEYEERTLTREEYVLMESPAFQSVQQALSDIQLALAALQ